LREKLDRSRRCVVALVLCSGLSCEAGGMDSTVILPLEPATNTSEGCPDDGDPCTADICEDSRVQHVETPWTGCRSALAGLTKLSCATSTDVASAPLVDSCIAQLESVQTPEDINVLWPRVVGCVLGKLGCDSSPAQYREWNAVQQPRALCGGVDPVCAASMAAIYAAAVAACAIAAPVPPPGAGYAACLVAATVAYLGGMALCVDAAICSDVQRCCDGSCVPLNDCVSCGCPGNAACCGGNRCVDCRADQILDANTCQCICYPGYTECNGECVTTFCPPGAEFNQENCACECPPDTVQCTAGTCHSGLCDAGMEFDSEACECKCPEGTVECDGECVSALLEGVVVATADNECEVSLNGESIAEVTNWWQPQTVSVRLVAGAENVIAISATNRSSQSGADRGVIASVSLTTADGSNAVLLTTDASWERATVLGADGMQPWGSLVPGANWIWYYDANVDENKQPVAAGGQAECDPDCFTTSRAFVVPQCR
jgi:CXCXC repeat